MITLMLEKLGEKQIIIIEGTNLKLGSTQHGAVLADLKGLKLSYEGVLKEHPDLEGVDNWREIAVNRLVEKLKSFETELTRMVYIKEDLKRHGFKPLYYQREGFRPERLE